MKIQAVEAALGRGTTVEQVPSEEQNETGTPDKRRRKGASCLLLAPVSHEDELHSLRVSPGDTPLYVFTLPRLTLEIV